MKEMIALKWVCKRCMRVSTNILTREETLKEGNGKTTLLYCSHCGKERRFRLSYLRELFKSL